MLSARLLLVFSLTSLLYASWTLKVNQIVPQPYLDEVFHIRQVQTYCAGRFSEWDPKITTPPGLYLISYCLSKIYRLAPGWGDCTVTSLRLLNTIIMLFVLPAQVWDLKKYTHPTMSGNLENHLVNHFHTISNTCLFPILFFFSGLYYTDVCSTSFVLGAYQYHCRSIRDNRPMRLLDGLKLLATGIGALLMRQTNIFWVAVFLGGLQTVHQLKTADRLGSWDWGNRPKICTTMEDPPLEQASLNNISGTAFSLVVAALRDPILLVRSLWPYLALLAAFSLFVLLNGGVVLGDRANHVASIHIPQMLYVWPCVVFFSWPIILPHVLVSLVDKSRTNRPRIITATLVMAAMALSVYLNTIVHPFTLADNRHYVFYTFKLLLRHPWIKYAAVPIYFFCAWAAIAALSSTEISNVTPEEGPTSINNSQKSQAPSKSEEKPIETSFLLVYLISTSLSLVTAPLVEPRYFILPWLIWRLHVRQLPSLSSTYNQHRTIQITSLTGWANCLLRLDQSIWLSMETAWFLAVNLATCWIFLYRGFEWREQPGSVQRFMW